MEPYQQRVVDEHKDLAERLEKLDTFISSPAFNEVRPQEQARLQGQSIFMECYKNVLQARISAFT